MPYKLRQQFHQLRRSFDINNIIRKINGPGFRDILERYKDRDPDPGYSKYLNLNQWISKQIDEAYRLKLHRQRGLKVLDLGTGCGYFPYICEYFGHIAYGLDIDDTPFYNEVTKLLQVRRLVSRITAFEPLPDMGIKFDLITAFAVCFNNHNKPDVWGAGEWDYFLSDLVRHHLAPDSRVLLQLNQERTSPVMDTGLLEYFRQQHAQINEWEVYFPATSTFTLNSDTRNDTEPRTISRRAHPTLG
ncbi:MAG: hypothetical protein ACKOC5_01425 [Chloroflexota bacterium]